MVWRLLLLLALAAAAWTPCLGSLQSLGGYAAVAQNHRRYVLGVSQAPVTASRQFAALAMLEEGTSRSSLIVAFAAIILSGWLTGRAMGRIRCMALGVASLCAIVTGSVPITALLGVTGVALLAFRLRRSEGRSLASWMVAAWLTGLSLAIPCYAPYPRLALPWLVVTWLAAGACLEQQTETEVPRRGARGFLLSAALLLVTAMVTLVTRFAFISPQRFPSDEGSQTGMRTAASEIATSIRRELDFDDRASLDQVVIYLYGEPALFFQLRLAGVTCHPVQDLGFATARVAVPAPTFVIVGERSLRDPQFVQQRRAASHLVTIEQMTVKLPRIVWLDEPWEPATAKDAAPGIYRFEILRVGESR